MPSEEMLIKYNKVFLQLTAVESRIVIQVYLH